VVAGDERARVLLELAAVGAGAGAAAGGVAVRRGAWLPQPASATAARVTSSAHFMVGEVR
jgi:hypothetical protein